MYSSDTEIAVLSTLFKNPDYYYQYPLRPYFFSSIPYQNMFSNFSDMMESGVTPDKTLFLAYLESKGNLPSCGGESLISYMYNADYDKQNYSQYVKIVADSYKSKVAINKFTEGSQRLVKGEDTSIVISDIRNTLDDLDQDNLNTEGVVSIGDFVQEGWNAILDKAENPGISGITTGIESLDLSTGGVSYGDLWIIAGRPGMGKTYFMLSMANAQSMAGHPVLISEREMSKQKLFERLIGIRTGLDPFKISMGMVSKDELEIIKNEIQKIKLLTIYVNNYYNSNLVYMESIIRKYKQKHNIEIYMLDYIQLEADRGESQVHEIGRITRVLKKMANDLNFGAIVLSQLNRSCELRDNKRPRLSDLKQSGNLEDDADIVGFLYRDSYYNPDKNDGTAEFIIGKARHSANSGTVPLKYENGVYTTF